MIIRPELPGELPQWEPNHPPHGQWQPWAALPRCMCKVSVSQDVDTAPGGLVAKMWVLTPQARGGA